METFAAPRALVDDPRYRRDRRRALAGLKPEDIDAPIRDVILGFAELPCCFTLQSCYGHFVHPEHPDPDNLAALPARDVGSVRYRIAYVALCVEHSAAGARLRGALGGIPSIDPQYVQFGSPGWFWERHLNSYALQVEPERFATEDDALIEHREALHVERVRNRFFDRLRELLQVTRCDCRRG